LLLNSRRAFHKARDSKENEPCRTNSKKVASTSSTSKARAGNKIEASRSTVEANSRVTNRIKARGASKIKIASASAREARARAWGNPVRKVKRDKPANSKAANTVSISREVSGSPENRVSNNRTKRMNETDQTASL
jgi:hypothetical protein